MAQRIRLRLFGALCGAVLLTGCAGMPAQTAQTAGAVPMLGAGNLVGATPATLDAAFGHPALLRVDGSAQVWLYHSPVCGLNLILYPDASGVPHVATAVPDNGDAARCTLSLEHPTTAAALEQPAAS
ncbi:MAG: hypothetical protein HKL97_10145 [Acidocella sp.]|nr:hypothetical protein [Acidocella sp.]